MHHFKSAAMSRGHFTMLSKRNFLRSRVKLRKTSPKTKQKKKGTFQSFLKCCPSLSFLFTHSSSPRYLMKDLYFHIYKIKSLLHQITHFFLSIFFGTYKEINSTKWGKSLREGEKKCRKKGRPSKNDPGNTRTTPQV